MRRSLDYCGIAAVRQLRRLRDTWDTLGRDDPLWAILSSPDKRGRQWDGDEFFAAGESEIAGIDACCKKLGRPLERAAAVDFGCGVGRLSRALASRYAQVVGVDISPVMLTQARELNAMHPNIRFVENARSDLRFLDGASVDLVYSAITLQHVPPALQAGYIAEFLRILKADGIAVIQIASGFSNGWHGLGYRLLPNRLLAPLRRWVHDSSAAAEIHVFDEKQVTEIAEAANRRILHVQDTGSAGRGFHGRLLFIG